MRNFLEKRYPGAIVVFLQGCAGNVRVQLINENINGWTEGGSLEKARRFGRDLGMAVEWALAKPGNPIGGLIDYGYQVIDLPLEKVAESEYRQAVHSKNPYRKAWGQHFAAILDKGQKIPTAWPYRIQGFNFAQTTDEPFTLIALQGEIYNRIIGRNRSHNASE